MLKDDIQDAIATDGTSQDLAEGKVPLFYIEEFEISTEQKETQIPLYFQKKQLIQEWMKRNPRIETPAVKVTELFSVLQSMSSSEDEDLKKLTLIPPIDSAAKAKKCIQNGGVNSAFKLGERIVIL